MINYKEARGKMLFLIYIGAVIPVLFVAIPTLILLSICAGAFFYLNKLIDSPVGQE